MYAKRLRLCSVLLTLLAVCVFSLALTGRFAQAQVTVSNPWTPYDPLGMLTDSTVEKSFNGMEEDVSLASGSLSFYLPLLNVPQRDGAAPLVLAYAGSSDEWAPEEQVSIDDGKRAVGNRQLY